MSFELELFSSVLSVLDSVMFLLAKLFLGHFFPVLVALLEGYL